MAHVLAPAVESAMEALVVDDTLVEAVWSTAVDEEGSVEPNSELVKAQMNQHPGEGLALREEHYRGSLEFPGQRELHPPVEFPEPSALARRMAVVLQVAASMAATALPE